MLYTFKPVANGLGTDHPIPDLQFVDDSDLPTEPEAIEAIGRKPGGSTWGREDEINEGGWAAFTTCAERGDLAWFVRFHPEHGRSVMLVRDQDAASQQQTFAFELRTALLFRSGGYWWDGSAWFRPPQIWDQAAERVVARPVPGASTVSAADVLALGADASKGRILTVTDFDVEAPAPADWANELALWVAHRGSSRPLAECVVRVAAPELNGDQLIGAGELAKIAGIAASTLRAYTSREEAEVPEPQAVIGGRNAWARPVGIEWAEHRNKSWDSVTEAVSVDHDGASLPVGKSELWTRFTAMMFSRLWTVRGMRQRWALRFRTEKQVRQVAEELGWTVAASLGTIVPIEELAFTIRHAILDEIGSQHERRENSGRSGEASYYGINFRIAKMLDWLIRHEPGFAQAIIAETIGDAEGRFEVPRKVTERSIRTALSLDGKLDDETRTEFLARAFPTAE